MDNIQKLVTEFLESENLSLLNKLAYAGMGFSKTTGQVSEIVSGIGFAEQIYSNERQKRMIELLGEMMFYWHVLASTVGVGHKKIIEEYINSYEAIKVKLGKNESITIQDMMNMKKFVKAGALRDVERARDNEDKRRKRERMM